MNPIRVLLADDHTLVRSGFRALIESCPDMQVVAEAGDGAEALRLIEQYRPTVALLDITMPGLSGLQVAAQVVDQYPEMRIIILSMYATEEYVLGALKVGAHGYLLKDAHTSELEAAISAVVKGETYLSTEVAKHVADYVRRTDQNLTPVEHLTPRQLEVLRLIAKGHTNKEIAQKLGLSIKTVETHRTHLMARLKIHDVAGLVRYAIRIGLITAET